MYTFVIIIAAVIMLTTAQPPAAIFLQSSYFDKVVDTAADQILHTMTDFRHSGQSGVPLQTFAACSVDYGDLTLMMPPNPRMTTTVVDGGALEVAFPDIAALATTVSLFNVKCSSATSLTSVLAATNGTFGVNFTLSQPLTWKIAFAPNATVIAASMMSEVSSAYRAVYTTQTGFVFDAFLQSFFSLVTDSIRSALSSALAGVSSNPLAPLLNASATLVVNSCGVASDPSRSSIQFTIGTGGVNCTMDWSGLSPAFAGSDVATRMPYMASGPLRREGSLASQCASCCPEPCPPPLALPLLPPMKFVTCAACFEEVESSATNVSFS